MVEAEWSEQRLSYVGRPPPGRTLGRIGSVESGVTLKVPIQTDFDASRDVSLAIDPVNNDGVDYVSREGGDPPRLIIEYRER